MKVFKLIGLMLLFSTILAIAMLCGGWNDSIQDYEGGLVFATLCSFCIGQWATYASEYDDVMHPYLRIMIIIAALVVVFIASGMVTAGLFFNASRQVLGGTVFILFSSYLIGYSSDFRKGVVHSK